MRRKKVRKQNKISIHVATRPFWDLRKIESDLSLVWLLMALLPPPSFSLPLSLYPFSTPSLPLPSLTPSLPFPTLPFSPLTLLSPTPLFPLPYTPLPSLPLLSPSPTHSVLSVACMDKQKSFSGTTFFVRLIVGFCKFSAKSLMLNGNIDIELH